MSPIIESTSDAIVTCGLVLSSPEIMDCGDSTSSLPASPGPPDITSNVIGGHHPLFNVHLSRNDRSDSQPQSPDTGPPDIVSEVQPVEFTEQKVANDRIETCRNNAQWSPEVVQSRYPEIAENSESFVLTTMPDRTDTMNIDLHENNDDAEVIVEDNTPLDLIAYLERNIGSSNVDIVQNKSCKVMKNSRDIDETGPIKHSCSSPGDIEHQVTSANNESYTSASQVNSRTEERMIKKISDEEKISEKRNDVTASTMRTELVNDKGRIEQDNDDKASSMVNQSVNESDKELSNIDKSEVMTRLRIVHSENGYEVVQNNGKSLDNEHRSYEVLKELVQGNALDELPVVPEIRDEHLNTDTSISVSTKCYKSLQDNAKSETMVVLQLPECSNEVVECDDISNCPHDNEQNVINDVASGKIVPLDTETAHFSWTKEFIALKDPMEEDQKENGAKFKGNAKKSTKSKKQRKKRKRKQTDAQKDELESNVDQKMDIEENSVLEMTDSNIPITVDGANNDIADKDECDQDAKAEKEREKKELFKRRDIRKVLTDRKLETETKQAMRAEKERIQRLEEKQKQLGQYEDISDTETEPAIDHEEDHANEEMSKERSTVGNEGTYDKGLSYRAPKTLKCVLEYDKDNKPLVEVNRTLVQKLKPHQVEAVHFMYNNCVESLERLDESRDKQSSSESYGCILAHCMGLGKTLSVITIVHTLLSHARHTKMHTCLVVCPRNTILNWYNEFDKWLSDLDFKVQVYEITKTGISNKKRAEILTAWHNCKTNGKAAVMIMGYEMYRNLLQGKGLKGNDFKLIDTFYSTLANPGPDLVVCDEGHVLKNRKTGLSETMSKIKTRRRIVLTGTPLQNRLPEYHCMVNFVKPGLLGSLKEFNNRFTNPITNGQCNDSSERDVRVMRKRSHILHRMLEGFVQRKDYTVLQQFLPLKSEYVLLVRLSPLQISLYKAYLKKADKDRRYAMFNQETAMRVSLFKDFQNLQRIWSHPKSLCMNQERLAKKDQKTGLRKRKSTSNFISELISPSPSTMSLTPPPPTNLSDPADSNDSASPKLFHQNGEYRPDDLEQLSPRMSGLTTKLSDTDSNDTTSDFTTENLSQESKDGAPREVNSSFSTFTSLDPSCFSYGKVLNMSEASDSNGSSLQLEATQLDGQKRVPESSQSFSDVDAAAMLLEMKRSDSSQSLANTIANFHLGRSPAVESPPTLNQDNKLNINTAQALPGFGDVPQSIPLDLSADIRNVLTKSESTTALNEQYSNLAVGNDTDGCPSPRKCARFYIESNLDSDHKTYSEIKTENDTVTSTCCSDSKTSLSFKETVERSPDDTLCKMETNCYEEISDCEEDMINKIDDLLNDDDVVKKTVKKLTSVDAENEMNVDNINTGPITDEKSIADANLDDSMQIHDTTNAADIECCADDEEQWWRPLVEDDKLNILQLSGKMVLLMEILRMSGEEREKVLVFSQSLLTLDIIEHFLTDNTDVMGVSMKERNKGGCTWIKNKDYFRMDGSNNPQQRKRSQDSFNDPSNPRARLFLISTRAGALGVNLVAANRVVLMDASWNPSHDVQAIFRAYRFGQTKPVYVYRLIAQGTMEEKIYDRQVTKQSLSLRVVDKQQIAGQYSWANLKELYSFTPECLDDPDRLQRPLPNVPNDQMLAELHENMGEWIVAYHEHDSLLENKPEQALTEEEKEAAWDEYRGVRKPAEPESSPVPANEGLMDDQAGHSPASPDYVSAVTPEDVDQDITFMGTTFSPQSVSSFDNPSASTTPYIANPGDSNYSAYAMNTTQSPPIRLPERFQRRIEEGFLSMPNIPNEPEFYGNNGIQNQNAEALDIWSSNSGPNGDFMQQRSLYGSLDELLEDLVQLPDFPQLANDEKQTNGYEENEQNQHTGDMFNLTQPSSDHTRSYSSEGDNSFVDRNGTEYKNYTSGQNNEVYLPLKKRRLHEYYSSSDGTNHSPTFSTDSMGFETTADEMQSVE